MTGRIHALALRLWHYHRLNHPLTKADAILVFCSHDTTVAERGAQVLLEGWAPLLVFSGGSGSITKHLWSEPEADLFAAVARRIGVPAEKILIENQSTNTGENVLFTRRLLAERHLTIRRAIIVQKPYMERRSYATVKQRWPEVDLVVTSPQVSFDEYLAHYTHAALSPDDVISIMVGDLQRIRLYPAKGFQIPQDIPRAVWEAYEELVAAGYDTHLVADPG